MMKWQDGHCRGQPNALGASSNIGPDSPVYDWLAATLRSLLPAAERLGVVTAAEVEIDTLAERLRKEALCHTACLTPPPLIGAWTRTRV